MENNEQQQQDNGKIVKKFNENFAKLTAIFGGETNIPRNKGKVKNTSVKTIVDKLLEDREKKATEEFTSKLSGLVDKHIEFASFEKEHRKQFEAAMNKKREEINKEADATFSILENIDTLRKQYNDIVGAAATDNTVATTNPAAKTEE